MPIMPAGYRNASPTVANKKRAADAQAKAKRTRDEIATERAATKAETARRKAERQNDDNPRDLPVVRGSRWVSRRGQEAFSEGDCNETRIKEGARWRVVTVGTGRGNENSVLIETLMPVEISQTVEEFMIFDVWVSIKDLCEHFEIISPTLP